MRASPQQAATSGRAVKELNQVIAESKTKGDLAAQYEAQLSR